MSLSLLVALAACVTVEADTPAPPRLQIACDASDARRWIGLRPSDVPLQDGQIIRTLAPGQAATMDYRVERLNLFVNDSGIITRVTCG
jgi:hypothetical protein